MNAPPAFVAVTAQDRYFPAFCSKNVLLKVSEFPLPTLIAFVNVLLTFIYHSTTSLVTEFDQAHPEHEATAPIGVDTLDEIPATKGYFKTAGLAKEGINTPRLIEVPAPPSPIPVLMQNI